MRDVYEEYCPENVSLFSAFMNLKLICTPEEGRVKRNVFNNMHLFEYDHHRKKR